LSEREFPAIADYGFLSDCHTGALVAPDGSVEWLCLPRFDSPSVFASLLDREAGSFRLGPRDLRVPVSRRYVPGTNILETTWMAGSGWLVVRDALAIGAWGGETTEHDIHLRPPSDHDAEHLLVRTAECIAGAVELELICQPRFDYGRVPADWSVVDGTTRAAQTQNGDIVLRLAAGSDLELDGESTRSSAKLAEGETFCCALSWGGELDGISVEAADHWLATTARFWRTWLGAGRFPDHRWRVYLQRSALALKGLTYAPSGAMVAALTTSLPETPGGARNWDYRYTWIRDASFTLWGLHTLSFDWEARDFMEFVAELCKGEGPEVQIMYGIGGEKELPESTLDHLSGYEGARPVRIGNAAHEQRQNDVYGALLDSAYIHSKTREELPDSLWEVVSDQVEGAVEAWQEPDQGIWEARGAPRHYVSSKLMCWVALDRGARLARRRREPGMAERWARIADEIRDEILERGVSERDVFRQHYETEALDASTLLVPLVRFLPPGDRRVKATVVAIADELSEHGLVLRYRVEQTDDGLSGEEGTFTICSFWLVSALSEIGARERARELCGRLLTFAGPLYLYAEEIEARSGRHLGNFPQAFTHLALINAVSHVIADDLAPPGRTGPTAVFSEMRARPDRAER
jgi:GH15 family glucan-1,4-alpha-glucosidase